VGRRLDTCQAPPYSPYKPSYVESMLTKSKLRLYLLLFAVLFSLWFAVLLIISREKQLANEPLARTKAVAIDIYVE
jgi:hypothetical protein